MTTRMPRQKINLPSMHYAADERIGRIAEGRRDPLFGRILHALHLIKAAPSDDTDGRNFVSHRRI